MSEKETNVFEIDDSAIRDGAVSCGAKTKGSLEPIRDRVRTSTRLSSVRQCWYAGVSGRAQTELTPTGSGATGGYEAE
ncbi:hypothetical protein PV326_011104 [Microctonus aethiopoides]|nr:hypothetical protein PV326_011104 [Microctonus aethiopoides]